MSGIAEPAILIVEDDEAIATGLALNLKLEGYKPQVSVDGMDALERIQASHFDLVLLDISLPRKNGLDLLREVRDSGNHVPVVVLSAREGEYDKVAALRLGADDYVTKPFQLAELIARVHAVLRRSQRPRVESGSAPLGAPANGNSIVRFGDVALNMANRTVEKAGAEVKLTHLEFELLTFFVGNSERVFAREELLRRVWGVSHGGSKRTVDNFVAQLRQKLEDDPEAPQHFITVRGSGYRFEA